MYQILLLQGPRSEPLWRPGTMEPWQFEDGKTASTRAKDFTRRFSNEGRDNAIKFRVVKLANDAFVPPTEGWRKREYERIQQGRYKKVPWANEYWFMDKDIKLGHYVHVSKDDPNKLAFTVDEQQGNNDARTMMKPGKYLARYYEDELDADTIEYWALEYAKENEVIELQFAKTAEEILHVYQTGPSSCMSHPDRNYAAATPIHPVTAYAGPDLAIAFITRMKKISARTLCWPDKKQYGRIYGDAARIEPLLKAAGYTRPEALLGARLTRINKVWQGLEGVICPYIDDTGCVQIVDDKYLAICTSSLASKPMSPGTAGWAALPGQKKR